MIRTLLLIILLYFSSFLYSQQSWQPLYIDDTIQPISILPISHDTIIFGIYPSGEYPHGGIYRSIDSGGSWQFYEIEYGTWGVRALMLDEEIIFAGTNWGIYKSVDWGESWEKLVTIYKNCLALEKLDPNTIFAGCSEYLLRSTNNGIGWDTCLILNQNTLINSILAVSDSLIYLAATSFSSNDGGLYASYDGGDNWTRIGLIMYNIQSLAISPFNELYAGCWYSGLHKSVDSGLTWENIFPDKDAVSVISRENEVFVGCALQSFITSGIFYSGDNGETWEDRTHNITNKYIRQIAFSNDDFLFSLSRYEGAVLGPPLNRSLNQVVDIHESQNNELEFYLHPNPANSYVNITFPESISDNCSKFTINLYDLNGKLISGELFRYSQINKKVRLDVSKCDAGLYFVKVSNSKVSFSRKLVIK